MHRDRHREHARSGRGTRGDLGSALVADPAPRPPAGAGEPAALVAAAALGPSAALVGIAGGGLGIAWAAPIAMVACLALAILLVCRPGDLPRGRTAVVAIGALTVLVVLTTVSTAWSPAPTLGLLEAVKGIGYAALFVLAAAVVRTARRVEALLWGVTGGMAALAVGTLAVVAGRGDPRGDYFFEGRLAGPVGYQNAFAMMMATGLLAALGLLAARPPRRWDAARRGALYAAAAVLTAAGIASQSRGAVLGAAAGLASLLALHPARLRLIAPVGAAAAGALLCLGPAVDLRDAVMGDPGDAAAAADAMAWRTAVTALALGAAGAGLAVVERRLLGRPDARAWARRGGITVTALACAALLGLAVTHAGSISSRVASPLAGVAGDGAPEHGQRLLSVSSSGRLALWGEAVAAMEDRPLAGQGAGGFSTWWNIHRDRGSPDASYTHDLALSVGAETGFPGVALLVAWLGALVAAAVAACRTDAPSRPAVAALAALVTAWAVGASFDFYWSMPAVSLPAVAAAGGLIGLLGGPSPAGSPAPGRRRVALALAALAVAGLAVATRPFLADRALTRAESVAATDPNGARDLARRAERLGGRDPRIDVVRAAAAVAEGRTALARAALLEGTRRNPLDYSAWERLGTFEETVAQDRAAAHAALERALELHHLDLVIRARVRGLG